MKIPLHIGFAFLVTLSLGTFVWGYFLGNQDIEVVIAYQDPASNSFATAYAQGSVSGTSSAAVVPSPTFIAPPSPLIVHKKNAYDAFQVWQEIHTYRASRGLPIWVQDEILCKFADARLKDLQSKKALDNHEGFSIHVRDYLEHYGFRKLAENMAQGYTSASAVVEGWKGSVGHHATLIASDLQAGCVSTDGDFVVLLAGRRH